MREEEEEEEKKMKEKKKKTARQRDWNKERKTTVWNVSPVLHHGDMEAHGRNVTRATAAPDNAT